MPRSTTARKPPKAPKKTRTAKGKASKPARSTKGKPAPRSPGTRDVFRRRVTTYDLSPEEKGQLEELAKRHDVSVSEMLAMTVRACIAGQKAVDAEGGLPLSNRALGNAVRTVAGVLHKVQGEQALEEAPSPPAAPPEPSAADDAARELYEPL